MNKEQLYKLPYPMFKVTLEEVEVLKELKSLYEKNEVMFNCVCYNLDYSFKKETNLKAEFTKAVVMGSVLEGFFQKKAIELVNINRNLLREVWLEKLIEHNTI